MSLPSAEVVERFAPLLNSEEARFQQELGCKRAWVRKLQGKPPWPTKEEAHQKPTEASSLAG